MYANVYLDTQDLGEYRLVSLISFPQTIEMGKEICKEVSIAVSKEKSKEMSKEMGMEKSKKMCMELSIRITNE